MVNKERLITDLARKTGLPKYKTKIFLEGFQDLITDYICEGEKVAMRGLMTIEVKDYKASKFYNFHTKTCEDIPAYRKVKIAPSKILNQLLKESRDESGAESTEEEDIG